MILQLVLAMKTTPSFLRAFDSSTPCKRRLVQGRPFERVVLCRTVTKVLSIGLMCYVPMFGREVVEGGGGPGPSSDVRRPSRIWFHQSRRRRRTPPRCPSSFSHPDLLQHALGLGLLLLAACEVLTVFCAQHRCSPVFDRLGDDLPEAERAIGDSGLGPSTNQRSIEQKSAPVVSAIARAVDEQSSSFFPSSMAPMMTRKLRLVVRRACR